MTNKSTTKRALLLSALSLLLCVSMLVGSTFAWFTDTVTSSNNKIVAGNLKVDLLMADNSKTYNSIADKSAAIFGGENSLVAKNNAADTLWEPGKTQIVYLAVENKGNLDLKYNIVLKVTDGGLVGALEYAILDGVKSGELDSVTNWNDLKTKANGATADITAGTVTAAPNGEIKASETDPCDYFALAVHMKETADNRYQDKNIVIDLAVVATQLASEEDSFGADYDELAKVPVVSFPTTVEDKGFTMTSENSDTPVTIYVPEEVAEALDDSGVTELRIVHTDPVADTANKTVSFDSVEVYDQNGNVVDLEKLNIVDKITVTLPVGNAFADGEIVKIYHDGELMATAAANNGYITYDVEHLCAIEVVAAESLKVEENEDGAYVINNLDELISFAQSVNAGETYKGKVVTLGSDIDLAGMAWTPIGTSANSFKGTFDGNDKVISNLYVNIGKSSNAGFFGFTTEGEVKNLTIKNADVTGRLNVGVVAGTPYTTKYTNINVTGHVEVNGMAYVGGVGGKNAYANWTDITVNVDNTSYVKADSVENGSAYRTYVGGVVGFNGEGGHTFKNITTNINVIGTICDIGGAFGMAHYNNNFENITCTGNVSCTGEADEIGGIAGVWHNQNGTTVTFTNCKFTGTVSDKNGEVKGCDFVGGAYSATGTGKLTVNDSAVVYTAEALVIALENKQDVILGCDIKIDPANMSNAYGKTGINVKYGQTIDGAYHTLNIKGAGGTWDSGINTTGGIIKNITVTGSFRGIFVNHNSEHSETVVLENVVITGTTYTLSCDQGMSQNVVATNCTFNGWTSYAATIGTVKFVDCTFGYGNGYEFMRPYAATEYVNCSFSEGYGVDPVAAVTFENCNHNGVAITAENVTGLVTSTDKVTVK